MISITLEVLSYWWVFDALKKMHGRRGRVPGTFAVQIEV